MTCPGASSRRGAWLGFAALACLLLIAGCQSKPKTTSDDAAARPPEVVASLTDQRLVYSCPQCGMDFDAPGQCSMDHATLVKTQVDYICPADHQPVERSGKCPRCAANATVQRTALAPEAPKAVKGN